MKIRNVSQAKHHDGADPTLDGQLAAVKTAVSPFDIPNRVADFMAGFEPLRVRSVEVDFQGRGQASRTNAEALDGWFRDIALPFGVRLRFRSSAEVTLLTESLGKLAEAVGRQIRFLTVSARFPFFFSSEFCYPDPAYEPVLTILGKVARSFPNASVLLVGKVGTGKETLARTLHQSRLDSLKGNVFLVSRNNPDGFSDEIAQCRSGCLYLADVHDLSMQTAVRLAEVVGARARTDCLIVGAALTMESPAVLPDAWDFIVMLPDLAEVPAQVAHLAATEAIRSGNLLTTDAVRFLQGCPWHRNIPELTKAVKRTGELTGRGRVLDIADLFSNSRYTEDATC